MAAGIGFLHLEKDPFKYGSYVLEDGAALPHDVGMTLAHQPIIQIWISLAQMVHFGWEQPLIIPDFGISKICVFSAHPNGQGIWN